MTTTTTPNIVPAIAIELPPIALDVLIAAMNIYIEEMQRDTTLTEQDHNINSTVLALLYQIRENYVRFGHTKPVDFKSNYYDRTK